MTGDLEELEALVPRMEAAVLGRKLGSSLDRTVARLSEAPRQADRFEALVLSARLLDVTDAPQAADAMDEASAAVGDLARLMQRASTIADLDAVYVEYPEMVTSLKALEAHVRTLWRDLVQVEFLPLVAVGRILLQIADLADLGARLDQLGREAQRTVEGQLPAEALEPEIRKLRAARDRLDAELHAVTGDPEVDRFLEAVTTATATLSVVTPGVLDWLAAHKATSAFNVRGAR